MGGKKMNSISGKGQQINFWAAVVCSVIMFANNIIKWWVHQDITSYTSGIVFQENSAKTDLGYKLISVLDSLDFLATAIIIISILFTLATFFLVGMGEVKAKTNFAILGMYAVVFGTQIFLSNPTLLVNLDYKMHKDERQKVVSMVEKGELGKGVNSYEEVELPKEYKDTSIDNGKIFIVKKNENKYIFFTTYRGARCDDRSAFVYSTKDGRRLNAEEAGTIFKSKKMDSNWFWGLVGR